MKDNMKATQRFLGSGGVLRKGVGGDRLPSWRWLLLGFALTLLCACSLHQTATRPALFDFGPGPLERSEGTLGMAHAALVLDVVEVTSSTDHLAVQYRLAYAQAQQLRPYALARWSAPPAQLLRQRLRQHFGHQYALLNPGEGVKGLATDPLQMQIELEEFCHLFESPGKSSGLLRLRATLTQPSATGAKWLGQRNFLVLRAAPSHDAAGGVRALAAASDALALELEQWLHSMGR